LEQYQLTKREYEELHKIVASKRAIKEMLETLKVQLASEIIKEEKWWKKMAKKHNLDISNYAYSINHNTMEIVGIPRPNNKIQPVPNQEQVRVRERAPELSKLVTPEELEAMRKM
jgi:hypothetical protein